MAERREWGMGKGTGTGGGGAREEAAEEVAEGRRARGSPHCVRCLQNWGAAAVNRKRALRSRQ